MSLSHQKPSFFSLALPRPPITLSPCVPLQQLPTVSPNRHFTPSRPRHSTDSWNSIEDETNHDWTPDQMAMLVSSLDSVPSHLASPFSGSIPPSNLLDKIGRHILDIKTREEWPHSLRSTRVKLLHIAKQQAQVAQHSQPHPTHQSSLASPRFSLNVPCADLQTPGRAASRRVPLYRQNSMDFLPIPEEKSVSLHCEDKLGSSLQRSERVIAHAPFHPYGRSHRFASRKTTGPSPLSHHASSDGMATSRTRRGYPTPLDSTSTHRNQKKMKRLSAPEAGPFNVSSTSLSSASSSSTRVAMATALGASNSCDPIISIPPRFPKKMPTFGPRSRRTRAGDASSSDNPSSLRRSSRGSLDASQSPKRARLISSTSKRSHPYSLAAGSSSPVIRDSPRLRRVGTGKYFSPDDENTIPPGNASPDLHFHRMVGRKISFGSDHGRGPVGIVSVAYILDAPFEGVTEAQK
ncbi:hypothetical protein BS47DRAFT_588436 [Hydnum rufescens UP504]|uniref:Uncharacterized protein n=1 Tax=Hydnum rufescens UP504 TaxID=1448309 RepID=A0A9P6B3E4_9AGAM|nr:hypothetical protein BS47DRAFT_588436 [Hydnum rufescens UP504]